MIKIIYGNLLQSQEAFLIHQCNAQGVMGSGVAKQIATFYPDVEAKYKQFIRENYPYGREFVMGKCINIPVDNPYTKSRQVIVNLIGQEYYGRDNKVYTEYRYLFEGILKTLNEADHYGVDVALPYKIGCCRGGGDWDNVVFPFLQTISENFSGDICIYKKIII